jgi:hypothetical protein
MVNVFECITDYLDYGEVVHKCNLGLYKFEVCHPRCVLDTMARVYCRQENTTIW